MAFRNSINGFGSKVDRVLDTLRRVKSMASMFANSFVHFLQKKGQPVAVETIGTPVLLTPYGRSS